MSGQLDKRQTELLTDRRNRLRVQNNILNRFISLLCAATGVYYIWVAFKAGFTPLQTMAPLLMVSLIVTFLTRPGAARLRPGMALTIDCLLAALSVMGCIYMIVVLEGEMETLGWKPPTPFMSFIATAMFFLILEATRRVLGWPFVIVVLTFTGYALFGNYVPGLFWHGGLSWTRMIQSVGLSSEGIWGIPTRLAAEIIVLFLIFAAFLNVSGASEIILGLSQGLFGRFRGGPAKMAVIASSLFGMINASGVANVASVGVITIPLMKKTGYPSHVAASIEALASTGGQIMPPVMAATAFVMAELLGVSYWTVCVIALLPSLLYYFSLFMYVDSEAALRGLGGLAPAEIPDWKLILRSGSSAVVLLPVIVLVVLLAVFDLSATTAVFYSLVSLWLVTFLSKRTRLTPKKFYQGLENGVRSMTMVSVSCSMAAVLMGLVMACNLGMNLSGMLIEISHGSLLALLVLTAIVALILGMGMPTIAIYVFLALIIAPALVNMGVPPFAAHLFIFYYGILNMITPPFCLGAFVAAGIADAPSMKVGWTASSRGLILYILPFMFVYEPALIFQAGALNIVLSFITALIGVIAWVSAIEGYALFGPTKGILHRLLFLLAGILVVAPGWASHLIGVGLTALAVLPIYLSSRAKK